MFTALIKGFVDPSPLFVLQFLLGVLFTLLSAAVVLGVFLVARRVQAATRDQEETRKEIRQTHLVLNTLVNLMHQQNGPVARKPAPPPVRSLAPQAAPKAAKEPAAERDGAARDPLALALALALSRTGTMDPAAVEWLRPIVEQSILRGDRLEDIAEAVRTSGDLLGEGEKKALGLAVTNPIGRHYVEALTDLGRRRPVEAANEVVEAMLRVLAE